MPQLTPEMLEQLFQLHQGPVAWDDLVSRPAAGRLVDAGLAKRVFVELQITITPDGKSLIEDLIELQQMENQE